MQRQVRHLPQGVRGRPGNYGPRLHSQRGLGCLRTHRVEGKKGHLPCKTEDTSVAHHAKTTAVWKCSLLPVQVEPIRRDYENLGGCTPRGGVGSGWTYIQGHDGSFPGAGFLFRVLAAQLCSLCEKLKSCTVIIGALLCMRGKNKKPRRPKA